MKIKKYFAISALLFLGGCTCLAVEKNGEYSASYCSTKDLQGVEVLKEKDKLSVKVGSSLNEAGEVIKEAAKAYSKGVTPGF